MPKQPKALYVLFCAELTIRFSYWGLQSLLVLLLTQRFHHTATFAYHTYGAFTALAFLFSIMGGFLADRFLGFSKTALLGISACLLGNLFLALQLPIGYMFSLAMIALGTGLFFPNNSNWLGQQYGEQDRRRSKGFTLYYMGTNLGALLGPIVYGSINHNSPHQTQWVFFCSVGLMLLWGLLFSLTHRCFKLTTEAPRFSRSHYVWIAILLLGALSFAYYLLLQYTLLGIVLTLIFGMSVVYVIQQSYRLQLRLQSSLKLIGLIVFPLIFFTLAFQVGDSLIIFAQHHVARTVFNHVIPAPFFASFEPIFIVLMAPILIMIWKKLENSQLYISETAKISAGFLFTSIAFLCYYLCTLEAMDNQQASLLLFTTAYLFLAIGELCIMPPVISMVSEHAPAKLKGMLMGLLFMSLSFSSYLSAIVANLTNDAQEHSNIVNFSMTYGRIAGFAFIVSIITIAARQYYVQHSRTP
tara:strand:- start:84715 stop:86124 length:1410 start_codon:yes stop_codon:yes gene_type:complete